MNKQALIKLATLRLAINHVLRQRMVKQAFWPFSKPKSKPASDLSDAGAAREAFLQSNKPGWGPQIPLSFSIPFTGHHFMLENINPFYRDPRVLRLRLMHQNYHDYNKGLLPHLAGTYNNLGGKEDPDRKYYEQNKSMLDNYRAQRSVLTDTNKDALDMMEQEFKQMYPQK